MTTTTVQSCPPHHWDCDGPQGPKSKAVCKKCGEEKEFDNFVGEETAELLDHGYNPSDPPIELKRGETMGKGGDPRAKSQEYEARWPEIVKAIQGSPSLNQAARALKMPAGSLRQILRRKGLGNRGLPLQHNDEERMLGVDFPGERRPAIIGRVSVKAARQGALLIRPEAAKKSSPLTKSREIDKRWPEIQAELEKTKSVNAASVNLGLCYSTVVACCKRHGVDPTPYQALVSGHKKPEASVKSGESVITPGIVDSWLDETMSLLVEMGAEKRGLESKQAEIQKQIEGIDQKIAGAKALIKQRQLRAP